MSRGGKNYLEARKAVVTRRKGQGWVPYTRALKRGGGRSEDAFEFSGE